jgi:hypothetical protein
MVGGDVLLQTPAETAREAVTGALLQPVAGELAGRGLTAARKLLLPPNPRMIENVRKFERAGVPPLYPAVAESSPAAWAYNVAGRMPGGATVASQYADDATRAIQESVRSAAGPTVGSEHAAGLMMQRGGEDTVTRFFTKANQLRSAYRAALPDNLLVDPQKYADVLVESRPLLKIATAKAHGHPMLVNRLDALVKDYGILDDAGELVGFKPLSFDTADELRRVIGRDVGKMQERGALVDPTYLAGLERSYWAVTEAMEDSLNASAPGKAALKAWQKQKDWFKRGIEVVKETRRAVLEKTPEQLYGALEGGNYTRTREILGKMRPEYRQAARGELLNRLGQVPPQSQDFANSVWDPGRFIGNISKLTAEKSPEGKSMVLNLLFGRQTNARRTLEDLGEVASKLKAIRSIGMGSPTAPAGEWIRAINSAGGLGAVGVALFSDVPLAMGLMGGVAGINIGPKLLTKLWTNPQFIRAMAYGTKFGTAKPGSFLARLGALSGERSLDEDERKYVENAVSFLRRLQVGRRSNAPEMGVQGNQAGQ